MDWLFDHPQILFLVVFALGSMLKTYWEAKKKQQEEQGSEWEPREPVPLDEDDSYRKRIPGAPPPLPPQQQAPPPLANAEPSTGRARIPARRPDNAVAAAALLASQQEAAALLKHQQELAARLLQIRETKATTTGGAAATRARVAGKGKSKLSFAPQGLRTSMKSRSELRRAIIMREILDRPVSLR